MPSTCRAERACRLGLQHTSVIDKPEQKCNDIGQQFCQEIHFTITMLPNISTLPSTPTPCEICSVASACCIVPERSEEWLFSVFCTRCLDALIGVFPLSINALHNRELVGTVQQHAFHPRHPICFKR